MFKSFQEMFGALLFLFLLAIRPVFSSQDNPALINIKKLAPGIVVDMRYATENNFTKTKLYPVADECLLCQPAAERLARVQKNLEKKGLGLKLWDCYRPISVQKKLWAIVPDPRYVADPKTGSRHNRGASVDLTLVDSRGRELVMPTTFDEFSEKAHRSFQNLPVEALKNREILESAMKAEGFIPIATEWWHFDAPEWMNYALRDEPLGSKSLQEDVMVPLEPMKNSKQIVLVTSKDWTATTGMLQRYERSGNDWKTVGQPWPINLGLSGMAWGSGGEYTPTVEGPKKKEGDNKAPAGIFKLGKAYGYADKAPSGSVWPYQPVTETWRCVDDPASSRYNQIFSAEPSIKKDWKSAELMKRSDHLYKWLINVEQNTPSTCGCGSCIFLHVWRKPGSGTEGCTAMQEENMVELLSWLRPESNPVIVQLPSAEYERLKPVLNLP